MYSSNLSPFILPIPRIFPIPGEKDRQKATRWFIPEDIALSVYPGLPCDQKLVFVRRMALAFQACWGLQLPGPRQIGELVASQKDNGEICLSVKPDWHNSLGGPFLSVRDYLKARIKSGLARLESI